MASSRLKRSPSCDNDSPIPDDKLPVETRLIKYLRMWRGDPNALTGSDRAVQQEIESLLEWYICECIPYGPANLGGWWSDGVIYLEISETAEGSFKLLGVTWIDCYGITPFEIDVALNPRDEQFFVKTTFRIGTLDADNQPKLFDEGNDARGLLGTRPRNDRDWAMAAELTPPLRE